MKMKQLFLVFILIIFPTVNSQVSSNDVSSLEKLDQISDEALQMANILRFEDSERLLKYFSEQFNLMTSGQRTLSMEEIKLVTESFDEAIAAVSNQDLQTNTRINKVMKFRLVVNTIASNYEPLWFGLEGQMLTALYDVKEAVIDGNSELFAAQLDKFLSIYEVVQPSMKIDLPRETFQQLNTKIVYFDEYRPKILLNESSEQQLEMLENDLKNIFDMTTEDEADPSLWWVIISTGSIILITLSYVGWRKYAGDKEKKKSRSNRLNN